MNDTYFPESKLSPEESARASAAITHAKEEMERRVTRVIEESKAAANSGIRKQELQALQDWPLAVAGMKYFNVLLNVATAAGDCSLEAVGDALQELLKRQVCSPCPLYNKICEVSYSERIPTNRSSRYL